MAGGVAGGMPQMQGSSAPSSAGGVGSSMPSGMGGVPSGMAQVQQVNPALNAPMGSLPNLGGGAFTPPMGGMAQQGPGVTGYTPQQGSGMPFGQAIQGLGLNRPQAPMPQGMPQGPVLDEGMRSPFAPPVQQMPPQMTQYADQAKLAALQSAMRGTPMGQPMGGQQPAPTARSIGQNIAPGIAGLKSGLTGVPTTPQVSAAKAKANRLKAAMAR